LRRIRRRAAGTLPEGPRGAPKPLRHNGKTAHRVGFLQVRTLTFVFDVGHPPDPCTGGQQ